MEEKIQTLFNELFERYPQLECVRHEIWKSYELLEECYLNGGKLLVAGNGGSAADSEHIVGELMKGFVKKRAISEEVSRQLKCVDEKMGQELAEKLQGALPAIALTGHTALSTAYLNDVEPMLGFAQQLNGYGKENDVFLAISTSGNSKNILYAVTVARAKNMKIIGLTGQDGGRLKDLSDVTVKVPEQETFKIQELHLPVYHTLCLMLEEKFF